MAGADKDEFAPLLRAGFHPHTVDELERLCVTRFPASITRPGIMVNLRRLLETMQNNGMRGEVWVNGSFLTDKLNPDDVDLILVVPRAEYDAMSARTRGFLHWFTHNSLYDQYKCDNYAFVRDDSVAESEWDYAYWLRQFGFSRRDMMKGLAVIRLPYVVTP